MTKINSHQVEPGALGPNALGNGVGQHDPRGMYGENQSEPTNMFGERAQPAWQRNSRETGGGAGQYPANQLPVPSEFIPPPEFRVIQDAPGPAAGQGALDQAAQDAMNPIAPQVSDTQVRRRQFERQLVMLDGFADSYEKSMVELRAIDPHHFDTHYSHLYKTNLPRSAPDTSISAGFTTFQAALAKVGIQQQPSKVKSFDTGAFVAPTADEQKLLPWNEGGYVGMSQEMAKACGVPWIEVQKAERAARAPAAPRAKPSLSPNAPQAWKESK